MRMHPCPSGEEWVGVGWCVFMAGRGAGRRRPHRSAPDAALPDHKKTRQGREGSALPDPFLNPENVGAGTALPPELARGIEAEGRNPAACPP
jgi:hypothetical protein